MAKEGRFTFSDLWKRRSPRGAGSPSGAGAGADARRQGLGLEIANIVDIPDAEDYAQEEFYRANFAPSEIARCSQEPRAKAAFQKILAAKRAIVKSGAVSEPAEGLRSIEIGLDGAGQPFYPGCLVSLSETDTVAAAACLWDGRQAPEPAKRQAISQRPGVIPTRARILAGIVVLSLLAIFATIFFNILQFAFPHP